MDLEALDEIDLSALGTPNLDRYEAEYEVKVDDDCQYQLRVKFKVSPEDQVGSALPNFEGVCAPSNGGGNAPDGLLYHAPRRYWMGFPKYVYDTTGFDHMSLYWRPCGLPPKGLRQPRYELNFYNVVPQYRAYWVCQEYKVPRVCRYNQTTSLGRGFFSIPRVERDPDMLANMPSGFQPDPEEPEGYQHEGLIAYHPDEIPETPDQWLLPTFHMSTYDGDTVSWRALLPLHFITGSSSAISSQTQFYFHQTKLRLPSSWNMTYNADNGAINVYLYGSGGLCGEAFEQVKAEQESVRVRA